MVSNLIIDNRAGRMTSREINVITTGAEKRSITGERVSIVRFGIFVSNATSHPVSTNGRLCTHSKHEWALPVTILARIHLSRFLRVSYTHWRRLMLIFLDPRSNLASILLNNIWQKCISILFFASILHS